MVDDADESIDLEELRRAFNQCSKNGEGRASTSELSRAVLRQTGDTALADELAAQGVQHLTWPQVMA
ncbi:unnamed protein product, partial [Phaeothamnion confervicola]